MNWPRHPDVTNYRQSMQILITLGPDAPSRMVEGLYYVSQLSDDASCQQIVELAIDAGIDLGVYQSAPEDIAIRVWIENPSILLQAYAEKHRIKSMKFVSYYPRQTTIPDFTYPNDQILSKLEATLNYTYAYTRTGCGMRVLPLTKHNGFWLMIRHGAFMRRSGTVQNDGSVGQVVYRPEYYDSVIYNADTGELAVNASTKNERINYCKCLGFCLFGDGSFFDIQQRKSKYSLSPLIDLNRLSLVSCDIEEIESISLCELLIRHRSWQQDVEVRRADDVFAAIDEDSRNLFDDSSQIKLVRAKFRIKFLDQQIRHVTIRPPGTVIFDRASDYCVISSWLKKRGFLGAFCETTSSLTSPGTPGSPENGLISRL
ncbi:hypothetical protein [Poriferisphaera corsica]|nr:hypothetical protein [Poriferisphaera corsica]